MERTNDYDKEDRKELMKVSENDKKGQERTNDNDKKDRKGPVMKGKLIIHHD